MYFLSKAQIAIHRQYQPNTLLWRGSDNVCNMFTVVRPQSVGQIALVNGWSRPD